MGWECEAVLRCSCTATRTPSWMYLHVGKMRSVYVFAPSCSSGDAAEAQRSAWHAMSLSN